MCPDRPRVCLITEDLSYPADEGIKKFAASLAAPLAQAADLLVLCTRPGASLLAGARTAPANRLLASRALRQALRRFHPDTVIYIPEAAATRNSFVRCALLRSYAPQARIVMVSLQPRRYGWLARQLISRVGPDLTLVQSAVTREQLASLSCPAALLPSGVDLDAFQPARAEVKARLRETYGVPARAFVVLHVGHLKRQRNLLLLNRIHRELGYETIFVGSTSTPGGPEAGVAAELERGGTRVVTQYIARIAEMYQLADCYLFPAHLSGAAIEMPLSILEAMACGLPVVTTPFGQITNWLRPGPGIQLAGSDDDLVAAVRRLQQLEPRPSPEDVRAQVEPLSWGAVATQLLSLALQAKPHAAYHAAREPRIIKDAGESST